MSTAHSRRSRWRAGLLRYGAEGARSYGDVAGADAKEHQALIFETEADLDEKLDEVRQVLSAKAAEMKAAAASGIPSGDFDAAYKYMQDVLYEINHTPEAQAHVRAMEDVAEFRSGYRGVDGTRGLVGRAWTIDNFAEPSDDELESAEGAQL